jgi:hypothetical protein
MDGFERIILFVVIPASTFAIVALCIVLFCE